MTGPRRAAGRVSSRPDGLMLVDALQPYPRRGWAWRVTLEGGPEDGGVRFSAERAPMLFAHAWDRGLYALVTLDERERRAEYVWCRRGVS